MGKRSQACEIRLMTTRRLSPSRLRLIWIIPSVTMLLMTSGCGAVIEDVFEEGFCPGESDRVANVTVTPRSWAMAVGDSVNVKADVTDRQGGQSLCLPFATWTSSDSTVAAVRDEFPLFQPTRAIAISPGTAYLRAAAQGFRDSVRITVTMR